jgi:hypothetical protein
MNVCGGMCVCAVRQHRFFFFQLSIKPAESQTKVDIFLQEKQTTENLILFISMKSRNFLMVKKFNSNFS